MKLQPIRTDIFVEHQDLSAFIIGQLPELPEASVLAVTSKIVALSEGRTALLNTASKAAVIAAESDWQLPTKHVTLTLKDGMYLPSAGVDESNAAGKLVLLPKNSFKAAASLRQILLKHYQLQQLGVLITDSRTLPLRSGVTGIALGYAGFVGLHDYRGELDLFDRPLQMSQANLADGLAAAAVLVMGEGAEQQPLVLIEGAPIIFTDDSINPDALKIDPEDDMYAPILHR